MTALEDSLILLKEITPAFRNLQIAFQKQKDQHEFESKAFLFRETALLLQKSDAEKALNTIIKTGSKQKIVAGLKGFAAGVLAAALLRAVTH